MAAPANIVQQQGVGVISADQANTYIQWALNVAGLRGFTGVPNMVAQISGYASPLDGGQGFYYYDPNATADDNGTTVIAPNGVTTGRWLAIPAVSSGGGGGTFTPVSFQAGLSANTPMGGLSNQIPFDTVIGGVVDSPAFNPNDAFNLTFVEPYPYGAGSVVTASISGTVMNVTHIISGGPSILVGQYISGAGIPNGTVSILSEGTGTGGTGTYNLSQSLTIPSQQIITGALVPAFVAQTAGVYYVFCQAYMTIGNAAENNTIYSLFLQQSQADGTYVAESNTHTSQLTTTFGTSAAQVSIYTGSAFNMSAGDWIVAIIDDEAGHSGANQTIDSYQTYMGGYRVA